MKTHTLKTVNVNPLNSQIINILGLSRIAIGTSMALFSANTNAAEPFSLCPTKAFIIQTPSRIPKTYGVELATGSYTVLSPDMGLNKALNGVGFSFNDNYIYGWDYEHNTVGRVGNDFQVEPLTLTKDSAAAKVKGIYVGDVAINENVWYGYRRKIGLFTVPLDGTDHPMTIVPGSKNNASYSITDFAFHPSNGFLYAVTNGNEGTLIKIDPSTGAHETLGTVITRKSGRFTFGAQFFDPDGNLYLSNNGDGNVYKVNIESDTPEAELFSYGPSSTSNDGARCALAEVPVGDSVDFGDAPDTYGTLIDSNGARHGIIAGMSLGSLIDNETDGYPAPLSDDESDGIDDDDGISMPTGFEVGEKALLMVEVEAEGHTAFLNGWIDWDQDGKFDAEDKVVSARALNTGTTALTIDVPNWAKTGETWSRFRLSSVDEILPNGGVSDGEVEDYPITVTKTGITISYYPSSSEYSTLAYEDLYPDQGDFDMNDVVMQLRISQFSKNDKVLSVAFDAQLVAMGAAYHNGFAVQLPGISRGNIQESAIEWSIQGVKQTTSPLESGQTNAVLLFSQDLWQYATAGNGCVFFRTEPGCGTQFRATWQMTVPFVDTIYIDDMPEYPYDPFIFATPNMDHGPTARNITDGKDPGRKLEVHLKNKAPTDLFDTRFLGKRRDASSPSEGLYFQDENGMSWAIEVPYTWKFPEENKRVDNAYIEFIDFAADATGFTKPDWYLNANESLIFKD